MLVTGMVEVVSVRYLDSWGDNVENKESEPWAWASGLKVKESSRSKTPSVFRSNMDMFCLRCMFSIVSKVTEMDSDMRSS